jgi:hypothetical protein
MLSRCSMYNCKCPCTCRDSEGHCESQKRPTMHHCVLRRQRRVLGSECYVCILSVLLCMFEWCVMPFGLSGVRNMPPRSECQKWYTLSLHTRSTLGMMALRISEGCEESTTMLSRNTFTKLRFLRRGAIDSRRLCLTSSEANRSCSPQLFLSGQGTADPIRNLLYVLLASRETFTKYVISPHPAQLPDP